jgi:hypothetical protein
MTTTELDLTADIIDVRDIIARIEEIEDNGNGADKIEHNHLISIMDDLEGLGGDEQWRGEWYPVTLIRDSYFKDYAQEFAEDIGAVKSDAEWPHTCIDWEHAARELQYDYTSIEIDDVTYWTR